MKLANVKVGDVLIADGGFDCIKEHAEKRVRKDKDGLYILCKVGHHYLAGQLDLETCKNLVGLTRKKP